MYDPRDVFERKYRQNPRDFFRRSGVDGYDSGMRMGAREYFYLEDVPGHEPMKSTGYLMGVIKTITDRGNVKASLTYGHSRMDDGMGTVERDNKVDFGLVMGW